MNPEFKSSNDQTERLIGATIQDALIWQKTEDTKVVVLLLEDGREVHFLNEVCQEEGYEGREVLAIEIYMKDEGPNLHYIYGDTNEEVERLGIAP